MSDPYPKALDDLVCPECGNLMVLRKSPKYDSPFYGCSTFPKCRGTHGAHPDGRPLGVPANRETKDARIQAHLLFDKLWKDGGPMKRGEAYAWFQSAMGMTKDECHIGRFDTETCRRAEKIVREELLRRRLIEIDPGLIVSLWLLYQEVGQELVEELRDQFEHGMYHNDEQELIAPAHSLLSWNSNFSGQGRIGRKAVSAAEKVVERWLEKCTSINSVR